MRQVNLLVCLAAVAIAQDGPINLNFEENGHQGGANGWFSIIKPGYSSVISDSCRTSKSQCAVLRYAGGSDPPDFGWIMQTFDATALRGKQVRYRAWLRVDDAAAARAQIFIRVDRPNRAIGFHDYSHDRPVHSRDWTMREIAGRIDADAVRITIGLM